jgi:glycine cleavage system regulatory protein
LSRLGPLGRIPTMPGDALRALQTLPQIVENTREIAAHTALLADVSAALERVSADTAALPAIRRDMEVVAEKIGVLEAMDRRMAAIEQAMPVLVEVQRHLAQLPEIMEKLLVALDGLNGTVETLQSAVEPMGRLASRMPGQRKPE